MTHIPVKNLMNRDPPNAMPTVLSSFCLGVNRLKYFTPPPKKRVNTLKNIQNLSVQHLPSNGKQATYEFSYKIFYRMSENKICIFYYYAYTARPLLSKNTQQVPTPNNSNNNIYHGQRAPYYYMCVCCNTNLCDTLHIYFFFIHIIMRLTYADDGTDNVDPSRPESGLKYWKPCAKNQFKSPPPDTSWYYGGQKAKNRHRYQIKNRIYSNLILLLLLSLKIKKKRKKKIV